MLFMMFTHWFSPPLYPFAYNVNNHCKVKNYFNNLEYPVNNLHIVLLSEIYIDNEPWKRYSLREVRGFRPFPLLNEGFDNLHYHLNELDDGSHKDDDFRGGNFLVIAFFLFLTHCFYLLSCFVEYIVIFFEAFVNSILFSKKHFFLDFKIQCVYYKNEGRRNWWRKKH